MRQSFLEIILFCLYCCYLFVPWLGAFYISRNRWFLVIFYLMSSKQSIDSYSEYAAVLISLGCVGCRMFIYSLCYQCFTVSCSRKVQNYGAFVKNSYFPKILGKKASIRDSRIFTVKNRTILPNWEKTLLLSQIRESRFLLLLDLPGFSNGSRMLLVLFAIFLFRRRACSLVR